MIMSGVQNINISVVVPIYNVEPYVADCLESVGRQTMAEGVECILVDDCGGDRSMALAEAFVLQYDGDVEFRIVHHKRNRGLSAARNTGVEAARGKYVYFLDSDDWITPDCLRRLYDAAERSRADVAIADFEVVGGQDVYIHLKVDDGKTIGGGEIMHEYAMQRWFPMAVNKLCRIDYLKSAGLKFREGLVHEDELWSYEMACTAKSMIAVGRKTYVYRLRAGSITMGGDGRRELDCYPVIVEGMAARARVSELPNVGDACLHYYLFHHWFLLKALNCDLSLAWRSCLRMERANPFSLWQVARTTWAYPRLMLAAIYSNIAVELGLVWLKRRLRAALGR